MPRERGRSTVTSDSQVSCTSPPPTSAVPTSVSSQRSPPRPLVSVSRARNSALASGCSIHGMQARGADGAHGVLRTGNTNYACWVKRRLAITLLALALVPVPPAGAADPRVRDVAAALDHDPVYVAP